MAANDGKAEKIAKFYRTNKYSRQVFIRDGRGAVAFDIVVEAAEKMPVNRVEFVVSKVRIEPAAHFIGAAAPVRRIEP